MADPEEGRPFGQRELDTALAMLEEEQRKLADVQRRMKEASTTVESANKMLTAKFDGRGELVSLTFKNTKYRSMAPAELATAITETVRSGRKQALHKVGDLMGGDVLPGISFSDVMAGDVDFNTIASGLLSSSLDLPGLARAMDEVEERTNGK